MKDVLNNEQLGALIADAHPGFAGMLASGQVLINAIQPTFFERYRIYHCTYMDPVRPTVFYLGAAGSSDPAFVLTDDPGQFSEMLKEDGGQLDAENVVDFVKTFLEVNRDFAKREYFPESVYELEFLPATDPEVLGNLKLDLTDMVQPPRQLALGKGFIVMLNKVSNRDLILVTTTITATGGILLKEDVLVSNLPLVQGK